MADKITRCMKAAAYLADANCNLQEASDHAKAGLRKRTVVSLKRALDSVKVVDSPFLKSMLTETIKVAKDKKLGKAHVVAQVLFTGRAIRDHARIIFRKCGAKVDF